MSTYIRPYIEPLEFRDNSGALIAYGERWAGLDGPPSDMYSVVDHPERFAPLHKVADALVDYLVENYDVDIEEGSHLLADHLHAPDPEYVTRAARITPRTGLAAPVTLVWTTAPAIHMYAGVLYSSAYPSCSCNACDERWNECADELEEHTFSIVAGGLSEEIGEPKRPKWSFDRGIGFVRGMGQTVSYRLHSRDGTSEQGGTSRAEDIPIEVLASAQDKLRAVHAASSSHAWQPWQQKQPRA